MMMMMMCDYNIALRHIRNGTAPRVRVRSHYVLRRAHAGFADAWTVLRLQDPAPHSVLIQSTVLGF